jgi:hypothetical protein
MVVDRRFQSPEARIGSVIRLNAPADSRRSNSPNVVEAAVGADGLLGDLNMTHLEVDLCKVTS